MRAAAAENPREASDELSRLWPVNLNGCAAAAPPSRHCFCRRTRVRAYWCVRSAATAASSSSGSRNGETNNSEREGEKKKSP